MKVRFDQIAVNVKEKKKPTAEDRHHYIGLEHLDSGSLTVSRWGADVTPKGEKLLMKKGDVLFGKRRAYQKKVAIAPFDGIFSAHGMVLRPNEEIIDRSFFPLFISSDYFLDAAIALSVGSLSPTINWKDLARLEFTLPPLAKQRELAEVLWAIEDTRTAYQRLEQATEELVKSQFIEMFGDPLANTYGIPVVKLRALSSLITKGASPKWQGFTYSSDTTQTLFVTSENVREGYLDLSEPKYVEDNFNDKQKRSMLQKGDLLINIVGASIGRAAKFDLEQKANINQAVALVRANDDAINIDYLLQYLNSEKALQMYDSLKSDVARANLSLHDIGNLDILVPPRADQDHYADFVDLADKSKLAMEKVIEKQTAMKAAVMREWLK